MDEGFDILWEGHSGQEYGFSIVPLDGRLRLIEGPGVYIVARKLKSGIWEPLVIGRTASLDAALHAEVNNPCVRRHHGSHFHVRPSDGAGDGGLASDLRAMWNPECDEA